MNTIALYAINKFVKILPPTRHYRFKTRLYQLCGLRIDSSARVVSSVTIVGNGRLSIGKDTFIGHETFISCSNAGVTIGNSVDIAPRVLIVNGTHDVDMVGAHSAGTGKSLHIAICDGVWIGAGSIILPGVVIGKKSVIAAGSVVNKDIPPYSVAAGVPCKVIKQFAEDGTSL